MKLKVIILTLLAILLINCLTFGQEIINTPSLTYFFNNEKILNEPVGGEFVKAKADYFGVAVTYKNQYGKESDIILSITKTIEIIRNKYPKAVIFVNNIENSIFEITDSVHFNFIHLNPYSSSSDYGSLNFYCLIELTDTTEYAAITHLANFKELISSIKIPQNSSNYQLFSRGINEKPILAFYSLDTYNKLLTDKIVAKINKLSSDLIEKQFFEIDISNNVEVSRASLFSCYFFKSYKIKLISK